MPGAISLRTVIDANSRLDELGTARLIEHAAEAVHKAQKQGAALGTVTPEAIGVRGGKVVLELGAANPAYIAPECVRGGSGDRRSDVFALGVILWEALAHVRLFEGDGPAVQHAVMSKDIPPVAELNANVPAELDAICRKALARDPADRYQSAKVMAAELAAVLDDAGYPEGLDEVERWLAKLAPPAKPVPAFNPNDTATGVSPLKLDVEPVKAEAKSPALPGWATRPNPTPAPLPPPAAPRPVASGSSAPVSKPPVAAPAPAIAPAPAPAPAPAAPTPLPPVLPASLATANPTSTLTGVSSGTLVPPKPVAVATAPTAPVAPVAMKLPEAPPGATVAAATPPAIGATTVLMGSGASSPAPAAAPAAFDGTRTAVLGSNAIIEATNAQVSAANPPLAQADLPVPAPEKTPFVNARSSLIPPSIANAVTVGTPAVEAAAQPDAKPASAPKPAPSAAITTVAAPSIPPPSIPPPSPDDFADSKPSAPAYTDKPADADKPAPPSSRSLATEGADPAAAVALPRARSRADSTGSRDVLAGWGWGTDSHEALATGDDLYLDDSARGKKRLVLAIGGAILAVALVTAVALGMSGGDDDDEADEVAAKPTPTEIAPATPPPAPPPPAEPVPDQGSAPAGSAAAAEPEPTEEPAATAEPEEPAPEEPAPEPAKAEPAKAAKVAPEPRKAEPAKATPRKVTRPAPRKAVAKKPAPKRPARKPAPRKPEPRRVARIDPAAAYKTGFRQFVRGDAQGALATFKASLASDPRFAPTWRGIGLVYEKLGRRSQATTAFRQYLKLAPKAGDAASIRARLERLGS